MQMKKVLSIILVAVMLLSAVPFTANATVTLSGTTLNLSGTVTLAELTGYSKKASVKTVTASKNTKFTASSTKEMFKGFSACTSINLSNITFSAVVDASSMFYGLTKLTSLTLPQMSVKNASNMFYNCSALTSLDLSEMSTSSCTYMSGMFYGCSKLATINTGTKFTSAKVSTMQNMFNGCASLTTLDISAFNTSICNTMAAMFKNCSKLKSLTVGSGFRGATTSISGMFDGCTALESVDVSNFVTYSYTTMTNVFKNCILLSELDLSGFQDSDYEGAAAGMFDGCSGLDKLKISDGFSITEDMLLNNSKEDYIGWANEENPNTVVSGNGDYAAFSGAGSFIRTIGNTPATTEPNNGTNITVADTISENFYLDDEYYGTDSYVAVNYNHNSNVSATADFETDVVAMNSLDELSSGDYAGNRIVSVIQAPAQATEDITITVYRSEADATAGINAIDTINYNVYDYCKTILDGDYGADLKELAETTLDYAAAAQIYFNYNTDNMATKDNGNAFYNEVAAADLSGVTGIVKPACVKSATMVAKSDLEINLLSLDPISVNDYSMEGNSGKDRFTVSDKVNGDYYEINIKGIVPANMNKTITVNTTEGEIVLSANSIMKVVARSSNANLANLAKAMYLYGAAAYSYFGA